MASQVAQREFDPAMARQTGNLDAWLKEVRALHAEIRSRPNRAEVDVDALLAEYKNRHQ